MYCNYFGFKEKPFQITPNPRFLYLSRNHKEAFAHLLYGINAHAGFIELTGEVGTGKTTVLRTLLEQLDDSTHRTALILNPCLSSLELLRSINREFGIPHKGLENGQLLEELNHFLLAQNSEGRTVVLVIDESQNLAPLVLEQIRLISNLETETDKLIQIVLAGQPELKSLLEKPELRQLAQRITVRYHLLPMECSDSSNYMQHRLDVAGGRVNFSARAMKLIFDFAKGSPRLINLACDRSLLVAYGEDSREIDADIARMAISELSSKGSSPIRKGIILALLLVILMAATAFIIFFASRHLATGSKAMFPAALYTAVASGKDQAPTTASDSSRPLQWHTLPESPYPAVNAILDLWQEEALPDTGKQLSPARLFASRGLSTIPAPSLRDIVMFNSPAILEIMPGKGEKPRFVALISADEQGMQVVPELPESRTISMGELAAIWTGRGYIAWKNNREIPTDLQPGADSEGVMKLQQFLLEAGLLKGAQSGRLDGATMEAVIGLQKAAGLKADGIPGNRTLFMLYRDYGSGTRPRLTATGGAKS